MSKYISIFFLAIVVSIILFFTLGFLFGGGEGSEGIILAIGAILILLFSYLIAQMHCLIDTLKKRK
ncbi:MAG: hypothetical protein ACQEV7_20825 [Bacillota bacterium]